MNLFESNVDIDWMITCIDAKVNIIKKMPTNKNLLRHTQAFYNTVIIPYMEKYTFSDYDDISVNINGIEDEELKNKILDFSNALDRLIKHYDGEFKI